MAKREVLGKGIDALIPPKDKEIEEKKEKKTKKKPSFTSESDKDESDNAIQDKDTDEKVFGSESERVIPGYGYDDLSEREPTVTFGIRIPVSLKREIDLHDSVRLLLPDKRRITVRVKEALKKIIDDDCTQVMAALKGAKAELRKQQNEKEESV